jgi:rhombotail lipoprotein
MRGWLPKVLVASVLGFAGCADINCVPYCSSHAHNASSLVEYLYSHGEAPPPQDAIPQLSIPLRVGLAFLPGNGFEATSGLDTARKEELLERIRKRFSSRKFVAEIVLIPDYYLSGRPGFEGLEGIQRLYAIDLMALVSYDQVTHVEDNNWSLSYWTIVGAYVVKGSRHDVSTLVDLAVVDPASRSLVLRAGGTDTRHGNTTLVGSQRDTRLASTEGFSAATDQMIEHFDAALAKFESDVKSGKAAVTVVRKNDAGSGGRGGGGAFGWPTILALLLAVTFRGGFRCRGTCQ